MTDTEQNHTPSSNEITEKEYTAISEKADDLFSIGKEQESILELKKGVALAESHVHEAYRLFFLGELAHYEKDYQEALRLEQEAFALRNDSVLILRNVGVILGHLQRNEEALEWFDRALAINLKNYHSLRNKGEVLGNLGRDEEAIEWFERALTVNPRDYDSLRDKGATLSSLNLEEEGLELINKALEIKPDDFSSLRFRAYIFNKLGRTEEAEQDIKKALKIKPQEEDTLLLDQIIAEEAKKEAEQEAHDRKIRLDAWQRLSARAAHRIGNQLFAARGALKILEEQNNPNIKETSKDLLDSINQIQRLNQQFKKFSSKENPRFEEISIIDLMETILRRYKSQAEEKKIECKMIPTEIKTWYMDRLMMEETLGELVENALYHTPPEGEIIIMAEKGLLKRNPALLMIVENTGEGIQKEYKEKIFEAFFTTKPQGTGLGLAIVKKFIELHNGRIRETGTLGKSARFEILLPCKECKEAQKT